MDADLQDPPELIPEMIQEWEKGYDDVYATRKTKRWRNMAKKNSHQLCTIKHYKSLLKNTNTKGYRETLDY